MRYALYVRKSSEDSGKQIQSIENQLKTLREKARRDGFTIVKTYSEEKSAKTPYRRPLFNQMLADLEAGLIDAIICWDLSRLSRNAVEGGKIQYLLQTAAIKQIVTNEKIYFPTDNSIMMTFELGMATEYSLALGKNVKRGMNHKADKGVYPNVAPIGYLNTYNSHTGEKFIVTDQEKAPLVRKLWDLLLTNEFSMGELVEKAAVMGLRTRLSKRRPEKKLSRHGLHGIFSNSFYYGEFKWHKDIYQGVHEPLITKEEFDRAQEIISSKKSAPRPKKHKYAFKGFIRCGECGASVTAEHKDKVRLDGSVNHRVYYRCTHRLSNCDCKQTAVREENLEQQFSEILSSVTIPEDFIQWAVKWLHEENEDYAAKRDAVFKQQQKNIEKINKEIDRLLDLRLQEEIDKDTFIAKKDSLMADKRAIEKDLSINTDSQESQIDKTVDVFEFCKRAKDLFDNGSDDDKKLVLRALGSHFYLKDQKLSVELAKPFQLVQDAKTSGFVVSPRFATLNTKVEEGQTASDRLLIENGAADGS